MNASCRTPKLFEELQRFLDYLVFVARPLLVAAGELVLASVGCDVAIPSVAWWLASYRDRDKCIQLSAGGLG